MLSGIATSSTVGNGSRSSPIATNTAIRNHDRIAPLQQRPIIGATPMTSATRAGNPAAIMK